MIIIRDDTRELNNPWDIKYENNKLYAYPGLHFPRKLEPVNSKLMQVLYQDNQQGIQM
jgi:hypothetical protein